MAADDEYWWNQRYDDALWAAEQEAKRIEARRNGECWCAVGQFDNNGSPYLLPKGNNPECPTCHEVTWKGAS